MLNISDCIYSILFNDSTTTSIPHIEYGRESRSSHGLLEVSEFSDLIYHLRSCSELYPRVPSILRDATDLYDNYSLMDLNYPRLASY